MKVRDNCINCYYEVQKKNALQHMPNMIYDIHTDIIYNILLKGVLSQYDVGQW